MPVSVVVGGQYGSEGKGKVAHFLGRTMRASAAVRVGGPNSGHTVIDQSGSPVIFRQLPTAAILPDVICVIPAGSYIHVETLFEEMRISRISPDRLLVDPNAVLVTDRELQEERQSSLRRDIGSTQSGTGSAVIRRIERKGDVTFAADCHALRSFIRPTTDVLREMLVRDDRIILEGTQGFGLSVLHSKSYPFATSRDTTAAAFVSEAGLSPLDVDDVVLVIRAFPIRVGGNSGPLLREMSWDDVTRASGSRERIEEFTSVTRTLRRVGEFDAALVKQAIKYNRPTRIVLNHLDHVDITCSTEKGLTDKALAFIHLVEDAIGAPISYGGTGRNQLTRVETIKQEPMVVQ